MRLPDASDVRESIRILETIRLHLVTRVGEATVGANNPDVAHPDARYLQDFTEDVKALRRSISCLTGIADRAKGGPFFHLDDH